MSNIKELIAKAQAGDCEAQYELACCYLRGNGGKKDCVKALNLLTVLAKRELEDDEKDYENKCFYIDLARLELGALYYYGEEVKQDYKQAVYWLSLSDNENATKLLADCYYYGLGVEVDYYKAFKYYKDASDAGHIYAQECLDRMLKEPHFNQDGEIISFEELL